MAMISREARSGERRGVSRRSSTTRATSRRSGRPGRSTAGRQAHRRRDSGQRCTCSTKRSCSPVLHHKTKPVPWLLFVRVAVVSPRSQNGVDRFREPIDRQVLERDMEDIVNNEALNGRKDLVPVNPVPARVPPVPSLLVDGLELLTRTWESVPDASSDRMRHDRRHTVTAVEDRPFPVEREPLVGHSRHSSAHVLLLPLMAFRLSAIRGFQRHVMFSTIACSLLAIALLFPVYSFAATVQPLRVTPAKAGTLLHGKCVGVGKPVAAKYLGFRCTPSSGGTVWVKVRSDGRKACWSRASLAAVPVGCLVLPGHG